MKDHEPIMSWGEELAKMFGDKHRGDESKAVAFLAQSARRGPALELGIGAGRIALPLAARGIRVDGPDISKLGGEACHGRGLAAGPRRFGGPSSGSKVLLPRCDRALIRTSRSVSDRFHQEPTEPRVHEQAWYGPSRRSGGGGR